jgi:hypothetical protein
MSRHGHEHDAEVGENFSPAVAGLPEAVGTEMVGPADGDSFNLRIARRVKRPARSAVRRA